MFILIEICCVDKIFGFMAMLYPFFLMGSNHAKVILYPVKNVLAHAGEGKERIKAKVKSIGNITMR